MGNKPKAIGLTCGIGSMLLGAKQAGFDVLGNIEWRGYYHTGTFEKNFPKAFMVRRMMDAIGLIPDGTDLAMGHPECGKYSQLNLNRANTVHDPGDIPLFIEMVAQIKPRFFVMDDLPMSFIAFPMDKYIEALPEYDLFPEWISNYFYGNIQKHRNRMFMIGALKTEKFAFRPGEMANDLTVEQVIGDIAGHFNDKLKNHHPHTLIKRAHKADSLHEYGKKYTWGDVRKYLEDKKGGHVIPYVATDGSRKTRPGSYLGHWDAHAHVMDGGSPAINAKTRLPYTIRERARIQGFPDDFEFVGEVLDKDGTWCHDENIKLVKQTGKAMPIQFCRYSAQQIMAHMKAKPFKCSMERLLKTNPYVDSAKQAYCEAVGYSDQKSACKACWLNGRCPVQSKRLTEDALKDVLKDVFVLPTRKEKVALEQKTGRVLKTPALKPVKIKAAIPVIAPLPLIEEIHENIH